MFTNVAAGWCHERVGTAVTLIYHSQSALHVSGDVFAHHQEHLNVFTASGNVHQCRCLHQPAATLVNITRSCKYIQVLLMIE
jgi:hypothetical protein